jgi:hypothetical protein
MCVHCALRVGAVYHVPSSARAHWHGPTVSLGSTSGGTCGTNGKTTTTKTARSETSKVTADRLLLMRPHCPVTHGDIVHQIYFY